MITKSESVCEFLWHYLKLELTSNKVLPALCLKERNLSSHSFTINCNAPTTKMTVLVSNCEMAGDFKFL